VPALTAGELSRNSYSHSNRNPLQDGRKPCERTGLGLAIGNPQNYPVGLLVMSI
jgi:hypothetical protein